MNKNLKIIAVHWKKRFLGLIDSLFMETYLSVEFH